MLPDCRCSRPLRPKDDEKERKRNANAIDPHIGEHSASSGDEMLMDFVGERVDERQKGASQRRIKAMRGGMAKNAERQDRKDGELRDMGDFSQKIILLKTAFEARDG